ncbi:MAG: D-aminopeptidase [candidate division BRC1 bacterium ADurb.BinA364]|nr:MAG: D-aminopeptidase [candidate division BRC1 bacterium ADurb.BinA364]
MQEWVVAGHSLGGAVASGQTEGAAGLILLGHHAKAGTLDSFLPHTMNGPWADFRINGRSVGEIGIESCIAGHFGAAPILAQGDEALCAEARAMWPAIATAAVKRATTSDRCEGLSAEEGRKLTAERIAQAIQSLRDGAAPPPYRPSLPMMAELELRSSEEARRIAANRPLARLCGEKSLCAAVESHRDILRWIVGKPS